MVKVNKFFKDLEDYKPSAKLRKCQFGFIFFPEGVSCKKEGSGCSIYVNEKCYGKTNCYDLDWRDLKKYRYVSFLNEEEI